MPQLIAPTVRLHAAWLEAHDEWGPGLHEDGFGIRSSDDVDSPAGFAAWVTRLTAQADPAKPVEAGRVHCTYRWIVEDDRVLGAIVLRHELNDRLMLLGHVGYGIRPSARGRGLATWALGRMLVEARELGLDQGADRLRSRQRRLGEDNRAPRRRPRRHPGHRMGSRTAVLGQDRRACGRKMSGRRTLNPAR